MADTRRHIGVVFPVAATIDHTAAMHLHLGYNEGRYRTRDIYLPAQSRLQHLYIIGATGTGKTTLLQHLMQQDAAQGTGFSFIDPHGDAASQLAAHTDCLYWNVADPACGYGYNPLRYVAQELRPLVASNLIEALKQQWPDAWGVRMEHLLRYAILALLDTPGTSMADILPLYLDREFRQHVVRRLTDAQQLAFWHDEFPKLGYIKAGDALAPIANKVGAFLAHPQVRKAITAPKQPLALRTIMDNGQRLIINLGKGCMGADTANVLGGLLVTCIANAAYSRQGRPLSERRPFFLYIDEFQSFTSHALADMLPTLRKYGVGLILATQSTSQTDPRITDAILANVGSTVCFRVGARDADLMTRHMADRDLDSLQLQRLPRGKALVQVGGVVCAVETGQRTG